MIPATDATIASSPEAKAPVESLMRLTADARCLRSADGRLYAQVPVDGRREIYALKSPAFRHWLIGAYVRDCGKAPSDWSVRRVLGALEAIAWCQGGIPSIFIRVGHDGYTCSNGDGNGNGSTYFLDLGDSTGQVIEIGPGGWEVVSNPRVHFRRPQGHLPFPMPSRDGSIELLRPYVNLTEPDFRLLIVWMAAALRPVGPYPILALYGEQGSAKSTLARVVRLLIDPQAAPLMAEPRNIRDLMVTAVFSWLLAYDNIGVIPRWLSDGLCILATAGAFADRGSFSTDERSVIHAQRPVVVNGIERFVRRSDLIDRSVVLNLPPISASNRRDETEFWEAFHRDYPRILGGLLDAVAGGLRELPSVELRELPRMAGFARFAEAIGRTLGWQPGAVLSDYAENRRATTAASLQGSVLANFLIVNANLVNESTWTAAKLLKNLSMHAQKLADSPLWPKTPQWFSIELRRVAPELRKHGIHVFFGRNRKKRLITLVNTRPSNERWSYERPIEIKNDFTVESDAE